MSRAILRANDNHFPEPPHAFKPPIAIPDIMEDIRRCDRCGGYDYDENFYNVTPSYGDTQIWCEDCYENHSFVCDNCGYTTPDDEATNITTDDGEQMWCQDCTERNAATCNDCNEIFSTADMFYIDNDEVMVCEECYSNNYTACESCGENFHLDDIVFIDGVPHCNNCVSARNLNNERYVDMVHIKKGFHEDEADEILPFRIGVEYESEWYRNIGRPNGYHSNNKPPLPIPGDWRFETDSSLYRTDGSQVAELISPPTPNPNYILGVVDFINKRYGSMTNFSAGIHVNVEVQRPLEPEVIVARAVRFEEAMFYAVNCGKIRYATHKRYAQPIKPASTNLESAVRTAQRERYVSVRFRNSSVLEFRAFASDGSINNIAVAIAFINALIQHGDKIDELPLDLTPQEQVEFIVNEWGWKRGGEWKGFWYDPRNPDKYYVEFYDGQKLGDSHVFVLPDEDTLVSIVSSELTFLLLDYPTKHRFDFLNYITVIRKGRLPIIDKVITAIDSAIMRWLDAIEKFIVEKVIQPKSEVQETEERAGEQVA